MNDEHPMIICLQRIPSKEEFFQDLGISAGRLGSQLFGYVYDCFFKHSVSLRHEYNRYYSVEYETLEEFLYVTKDIVLDADALAKPHLLFVDNFHQIINSDYEDNKLETILECIKRVGNRNEN